MISLVSRTHSRPGFLEGKNAPQPKSPRAPFIVIDFHENRVTFSYKPSLTWDTSYPTTPIVRTSLVPSYCVLEPSKCLPNPGVNPAKPFQNRLTTTNRGPLLPALASGKSRRAHR
jgi:hypothetical protein